MAIVAAGIIIGYDWQSDKRFKVRLDLYSYTSENSASAVVTEETFSVEDAEGFVNASVYTFVREYILSEWGMTLTAPDTIEIINTYMRAPGVAALNSKFSAFWKLDEDTDAALPLSDSVGGFDLTNNNGVLFGAGAVGAAANFYPAASMKSLTRAYDAALNPTDGLTFSCRVKLSSPGGIQGIAGTWTATSKGWALVMDAGFGGSFSVYVAADGSDAGSNYGSANAGGWNDSLWHRVVVRIDGAGATDEDRLQITVDDVPQTLFFTGTIPAAIMDDGGAFTIGDWNGNYADGMIDECELRDLSGALIAQWKFDGAPRVDSIGSNDLAEIGTVTREAVAGGGWAAVFNGFDTYLTIGDSADLASGDFDWSIALWVKPGTFASDGPIFSSWYVDPNPASSRSVYELWWVQGSYGDLSLFVHDGTTLNQYQSTSLTVPIDRWSLIVAQYDAATDTISVQVGQQAAEAFVLPAPILTDSNYFAIGQSGNDVLGAYFFTGAIRRVSYAPHLLTAAEVSTLWNNGAGQDWPMEEAQPEGNTRYCRLGVDHEATDTTKTNVPGMSFVLEAGLVYSFQFTLFTTSNDPAVGVQVSVLLDGGSETAGRCNYQGPASDSALQWLTDDSQPFDFDPIVSQGNVPGTVMLSGTIEVLTSGALQLQHGSSDASLTTVLRGSWGQCAKHNS